MTTANLIIQDLDRSDADVTRILDRLDAAEREVPGTKRRSPRNPLRGTAMLVTLRHTCPFPVTYRVRLRNVSQGGVAFLAPRPMLPGIPLKIDLPLGPSLETVEKSAIVRHSRHIERLLYEIGVEFETDS